MERSYTVDLGTRSMSCSSIVDMFWTWSSIFPISVAAIDDPLTLQMGFSGIRVMVMKLEGFGVMWTVAPESR